MYRQIKKVPTLHSPHPLPLPNGESRKDPTTGGRVRGFIRFLLFLLLFPIFCLPAKTSFAFRDLGIPVKDAICWRVHAGPGKTGEKNTIYLSFGQYKAPLFLLAVNPETGEMRQFNGPLSSEMGSWGFTVDHENRIYLGSYYNAHLLRFDPKTEKSENFGRMDPDQFYCYPTAGENGLIYCAIQFEKMDIVVFDPKNDQLSLMAKPPVPIDSGMAIKGRKIYFGSGANLYEFEIPLDPPIKLIESNPFL